MFSSLSKSLLALGCLADLAGCASMPLIHRDGERPGIIERMGSAAELGSRRSHTCPPPRDDETLALIRYTANDHVHWRAFPLPPGSRFEVGDRVLLDVNACRFGRAE